ncbi:MAG: DedA family protein [Pseudomonadales bacterium]|nr:DedA family protein [Pseudomonadales bacterium]
MLQAGQSPFILWLVASTGNTLGAVVNWVLGRYAARYRDRDWFPFQANSLARGEQWFQKYGVWSLLLAWMPIGGDALTAVAGFLRVRFLLFLLLVAIGKSARYAVVILVFLASK